MTRELTKLTYVHGGDPGPIGATLDASRRLIHFGLEGSGLLAIPTDEKASAGGKLIAVRVDVKAFDELPGELRDVVGAQVPCLLAHSGAETVIVVPTIALSRSTATLTDLRGKIRYGIARIGWELEPAPRT